MKTHLFLTSLFVATSLFGQSFTNATVVESSARGGVAQAIGSRDGWFAWSVPMAEAGRVCCSNGRGNGCCSGCSLTGDGGWSFYNDERHQPTSSATLAIRLEGGTVTRARLFDSNCAVDGGGKTIHVLRDVDAASSIAFLAEKARTHSGSRGAAVVAAIAQHGHPNAIPALERLAGVGVPSTTQVREDALFWIGQRGGDRGVRFLADFIRDDESRRLREKAVFSLSQNKSAGAIPALIAVARNDRSEHIRRQAIFWLGQAAGTKAADELRRAVDEDPDEDVREHAVFAISQLPKERSVPMLIDLVRNHTSPGVRKKAMFWLTQTGDQRALDVIEEILRR